MHSRPIFVRSGFLLEIIPPDENNVEGLILTGDRIVIIHLCRKHRVPPDLPLKVPRNKAGNREIVFFREPRPRVRVVALDIDNRVARSIPYFLLTFPLSDIVDRKVLDSTRPTHFIRRLHIRDPLIPFRILWNVRHRKMSGSLYDPFTWIGIALWMSLSYFPLFFQFVYVSSKYRDGKEWEWFHGTKRGIWRISGKLLFIWFLLFGLKGIAQFFAWEENLVSVFDSDSEPNVNNKNNYPIAMIFFLVSIFIDCLWTISFFSVHDEFYTSTILLFVQIAVVSGLVFLYFTLSIIAGALISVYLAAILVPMTCISVTGCRAHTTPDSDLESEQDIEMDGPDVAPDPTIPVAHVTEREPSPEPERPNSNVKKLKSGGRMDPEEKRGSQSQSNPRKSNPRKSETNSSTSVTTPTKPDRKKQLAYLKIPTGNQKSKQRV